MKYYTSQIAKIVGVHPNTVRLYEKLNLISNVPRNKKGYRLFSDRHIDEMKFTRIIMPGPYPVDKSIVLKMIDWHIKQDYEKALSYAYEYHNDVIQEKSKTNKSLELLNKWKRNLVGDNSIIAFTRKEVSNISKIPIETIRTWERAGIVSSTKKSNRNIYSVYEYEKIMIIYILRKAGFSLQSIYEFFNNTHYKIPSDFFKEIYKDEETICQTNEWIKFLDKHIDKSKEIIKELKNKICNPPL
ncbi:MAG: MerR family transcriptional regulator [Clostridiaceae bacterium]|nr:MerR family transcriptional regulator [Clostridiaceae bacterium]